MTPEGKVKAAIKRVLKELGAYQHWPVQNGMGAPCLDVHGCWLGIYFAIEAKRPGGVPTPRQEETIKKIAAAEGVVMVISSVEGANSIPEWLREHRAHVARRHSY